MYLVGNDGRCDVVTRGDVAFQINETSMPRYDVYCRRSVVRYVSVGELKCVKQLLDVCSPTRNTL